MESSKLIPQNYNNCHHNCQYVTQSCTLQICTRQINALLGRIGKVQGTFSYVKLLASISNQIYKRDKNH